MTSVTLVVHGQPAPKGSLRGVGKGRMTESNENVAPWRSAICAEALAQDVRDLDGPLGVAVTLTCRKPLRGKQTDLPITRASGDVDKHLRTVLDALQDASLIVDDARVVTTRVAKTYAGQSLDSLDTVGAVITVWTVEL